MAHVFWIGAALLGAVPFAFLIGRLLGVDIRRAGSGNVGATNLARTTGLGWGVLAFALDAGKGALPVWLARHWFPGLDWLPGVAGGAAVLGHCFSPYLRFRGGKGVATTAGALAAMEPLLAGILLAVWGVLLAVFRNVGVASSLAACAAVVIGAYRMMREAEPGAVPGLLLVLLGGFVIVRHGKNLRQWLGRPAPTREARQ